jgi:hypothetical protein
LRVPQQDFSKRLSTNSMNTEQRTKRGERGVECLQLGRGGVYHALQHGEGASDGAPRKFSIPPVRYAGKRSSPRKRRSQSPRKQPAAGRMPAKSATTWSRRALRMEPSTRRVK